jgi:hypothetical protein
MGVLSDIFGKIFPGSHPAASSTPAAGAASTSSDAATTTGAAAATPASTPISEVDVETIELNFTGDTNDSAAMNVWLHKQVMTKVAANGGKVPADLL